MGVLTWAVETFGASYLRRKLRLAVRLVVHSCHDVDPTGRGILHPAGRVSRTGQQERELYRRKEQSETPGVAQIHIVQNWFEELKRLYPTGK